MVFLSGILARLKSWALMALVVLAVLAGAYAAGGRAARRSQQIKAVADILKGVDHARKAHDDIESLDNAAVRERARQRMRRSVPPADRP